MNNFHLNIIGLLFLIVLFFPGNTLTELPDQLGEMVSLRSLDVSANQITHLPLTLAKLKCLENITVDSEKMVFPPSGSVVFSFHPWIKNDSIAFCYRGLPKRVS